VLAIRSAFADGKANAPALVGPPLAGLKGRELDREAFLHKRRRELRRCCAHLTAEETETGMKHGSLWTLLEPGIDSISWSHTLLDLFL
jgi:hypothetical protein